jgi:hypothetical protein
MKTQNKWPEIVCMDAAGAVLGRYPLNALPLREDTVLRLSIEFFGDPEPCMIHRSAVMSRMYMELYDYLTAAKASVLSEWSIEELPQRLGSFFADGQTQRILIHF